jgi:tRNA-splicing endonuclease subunit Sen54
MSHALLTPNSIYPKMLITRGHIHDSLGIAVRHTTQFARQTTCELLPEEALYLLERGSLQIWIGPEPETETDFALGVGTWKDEEYGVKGAVEMSVMGGYACFLGKEGLTWEKYQVSLQVLGASRCTS